MKPYEFPPISETFAAAHAALQANVEKHSALTAQRDAARLELEALEKSGENTQTTAAQIATKRIALDLFERDLKQAMEERPELQRALADAFHEFRRASKAACLEFQAAVNAIADEAAQKARKPFGAALEKASRFSLAHADNDYFSSDLSILLKHGPRLLNAWNDFTKGAK